MAASHFLRIVLIGNVFDLQVVHAVLTLFTREQLTESVANEGSAGTKVVEKLLEILQLVVKETDLAFRRFIDSTLTLCLDQIYPLVAEVSDNIKIIYIIRALSGILLPLPY